MMPQHSVIHPKPGSDRLPPHLYLRVRRSADLARTLMSRRVGGGRNTGDHSRQARADRRSGSDDGAGPEAAARRSGLDM